MLIHTEIPIAQRLDNRTCEVGAALLSGHEQRSEHEYLQ